MSKDAQTYVGNTRHILAHGDRREKLTPGHSTHCQSDWGEGTHMGEDTAFHTTTPYDAHVCEDAPSRTEK